MNKFKLIHDNYARVVEDVAETAHKAGRDPGEIKIVVVTKGHPAETIRALIELGAADFGENRTAEAESKIAVLSGYSGVKWHMIGHIQSRKAGPVVENFNFVHSVDRLKIAQRLNHFAGLYQKPIPVLLQFNVSGEPTKSGWPAENEKSWPDIEDSLREILQLEHLQVKGLMTMAPYGSLPELARPYFARLRRLRDFLALCFPEASFRELSMGMSADYQAAVLEGATLVRIGSAVLNT
ncbi:MAG: YggS family pyridoxal phosphate-dependent enzyme [Anaerolineae bacterium]|nr:YggS family pyridoxal phosphate-dependent enzyme [Anaerolineae bacterium]